jgi:hypothetical protein
MTEQERKEVSDHTIFRVDKRGYGYLQRAEIPGFIKESDLECMRQADRLCGVQCSLFRFGLDAWDQPQVELCNGRILRVEILADSPEWIKTR